MHDFEGRSIIVTGAASGIGNAIATHLANQGAFIGIFDLNAEGATEAAAAITRDGGRAAATVIDITDYQISSTALYTALSTMLVGTKPKTSPIQILHSGRKSSTSTFMDL